MPSVKDETRLLVPPVEAAAMLSISPRKLWSLAASHQIVQCKVGRSVRYSVDDLRAFVEQQRTGANTVKR
jgi:excisionase family DNA binding protein